MADVMGLFIEMLTNTFALVTKPFSLFKLACLVGARTVGLVTLTSLCLVKAVISVHVDVWWRILIWTIAILSLPVRILASLQRERLLEHHIHEMQIQLESLVWEKVELEEHLKKTLKDCRIMETMLAEVEEEHDKAITKIDLLENELEDLKEENLRLNALQGEDVWDHKARGIMGDRDILDSNRGIPLVQDYGVSSWSSGFSGSGGMTIQDLLMHGGAWEPENQSKLQKPLLLKPGSKVARPYPFSPRIISRNLMVDEALDRRRCAAISQSIFSTILSLLVGMVIWEAKDPCMPLVVALFTVVGISLKSVVEFFSTIKARPASDAVALLSFNCFILGTITSPTLPRIAHLLVPPTLKLLVRMVTWFGFSVESDVNGSRV